MLAELATQELSRRSLLDFCRRMMPGFEAPRHILYLIDALEQLERGEGPRRLIISMPPRHGKSALCQLFIAWVMGRHGDTQSIVASYGQNLSDASSYKIREYMTDSRWPFEVTIKSDSQARDLFRTDQNGYCLSAGVGARCTGFGGMYCVADDLYKGAQEAASPTTQSETLNWFNQVLLTRMYADSRLLLVGTRWNTADVADAVLDGENANLYRVINLPGLAEDDDPLGRAPGEALWPERFPAEFLRQQQVALGSQAFSALYQGQPVPSGGNLFRSEWFANRFSYDDLPSDTLPTPVSFYSGAWTQPQYERPLFKICALDSSYANSLASDYSVLITLGTDGERLYVLDMFRARLQLPELERMLLQKYRQHRPVAIAIEAASSGLALAQTIGRSSLLPIVMSTPRSSKEARWQSVIPLVESGKVLLPKEGQAAWTPDFLREMLAAPHGRYDDVCDSFALGLKYLTRLFAEQRTTEELAVAVGDLTTRLTP